MPDIEELEQKTRELAWGVRRLATTLLALSKALATIAERSDLGPEIARFEEERARIDKLALEALDHFGGGQHPHGA